jgi:hypothetical protein
MAMRASDDGAARADLSDAMGILWWGFHSGDPSCGSSGARAAPPGVSSAPEATQKRGDGAGLSLGHQQGQIVVWHQGGLFIGPRLITRVKPSVQPESARDLEMNMSCYEFGFGCGFGDNFLL